MLVWGVESCMQNFCGENTSNKEAQEEDNITKYIKMGWNSVEWSNMTPNNNKCRKILLN